MELTNCMIEMLIEEKAKNDLLSIINASVSHELRNPLNSISLQNEIEESFV